jgi:nitrogen PTS system EIIA component
MNCKLSDILLKQHIWMTLPSTNKSPFLNSISTQICEQLLKQNKTLNPAEVYLKLLEREQKASTGADHGLAIPHACLDGVEEAMLFLFRCQEGVEFNSMDGLPSQIFFVILAPEKRKVGELGHLQVLSAICRLMRHVGVREKLLMASSKEEILNLLQLNEG